MSEYQVLNILRHRDIFLKYQSLIESSLFESPQTRYLFTTIAGYHADHAASVIPLLSLKALLRLHLKASEHANYKGQLTKIKQAEVKDSALHEGVLRRFTQRQLLKQAVVESVHTLDHDKTPDVERIKQIVERATLAGNHSSGPDTYDYFHDPLRRIHAEAHEPRIATQISEELDRSFAGGLAAGEIALIIAPTGFGKTLTLINIGHAAMIQGKKVVHVTLEINPFKVGKRYDVRATGLSFEDISKSPKEVQQALKELRKKGAGLHIKEYISERCSVEDLTGYLERLKRQEFEFDLVIVDHMDLMYASRPFKEKRHELSSIIAGLRRMGNYFHVPVWTASQGTRRAGEAGHTTLWDVAEDIGKANWVDLALTLSQTEPEKEEGLMYIRVAKNRMGGGNPRVLCSVDYDTMTLTGRESLDEHIRSRSRTEHREHDADQREGGDS